MTILDVVSLFWQLQLGAVGAPRGLEDGEVQGIGLLSTEENQGAAEVPLTHAGNWSG